MTVSVRQTLEIGGISLQLRACISSAALHSATEASAFAPEHAGSQAAMPEPDPLLLLAAMQPGLAQALQGLQQNLVEQTLVHLEKQVVNAVEDSQNRMSQVDTHTDEFGVAVGLEIAISHVQGGLLLEARNNGKTFESYAPRNIDTALKAADYLIRGSQPPRALFRCRDTPVR